MFRFLSKQIHIFSIPIYILVLLLFISAFNVLVFNLLNTISSLVALAGIALGYFIFQALGLNNNRHLPLFIYTLFIIWFYFGSITFPLSFTLLGSHIITLILVSKDEIRRKKSYFLVGFLIGIMYLVMPESWPLLGFAFLQVFITSDNIASDLLKILYALILTFISYCAILYLFDLKLNLLDLVPYIPMQLIQKMPSDLLFLIPIVLFIIYSLGDNFLNFTKISPQSKFRYHLILIALICEISIIVFYMNSDYEFLLLSALPASIIISRGLTYIKNPILQEILLWVIILSGFGFKLAYYFY